MTSNKLERNLISFEKAIDRLDEVLNEKETSIVRDATVQRFEFTYELMWKTLKLFLEHFHGIRVVSPRQVFKESYLLSLIEDEDIFLDMIQSRNLLSHTYNEEQAVEIYKKCFLYAPQIKAVLKQLQQSI